jgi:2,3-dihydroxybenzoate decarboxylase
VSILGRAVAGKLMHCSIPFNLWRASHWINHPFKKGSRPMEHDYSYYFTHNVSISTSGNFNTRGLKYCIEEIGLERCMYAIGRFLVYVIVLSITDVCRYTVRDG